MEQPAVYRDPKSIDVLPTFIAGVSAAGRNYLPLLGTLLIVAVPTFGFLLVGCPTILRFMTVAGSGASIEHIVIPAHEWIVLAGTFVFSLGLGSWCGATLLRMCDAVLAGEPCPTVPAAYGGSIERIPAVIGTYVCVIALTIVGTLLCILPGIYVALVLGIAPTRAATRGRGPLDVLRDSFALTKGRWWRVFGYMLLLTICMQAIYLPISLPLQMGPLTHGGVPGWYLPMLLVLSMLLGIFQLSCQVALHRRLEQLGPLNAARAPAPPGAQAPPEDEVPAPEPGA